MMRRRVVIYGVVVLALAAVAALLGTSGHQEPSYQGRPLSDWIHEATEGPEDQRQRAIDAMLAMEPDLFPWLVRMLEPREQPLTHLLRKLTGRRSLFGFDLSPSFDQQQQALLAFQALGSAAGPAIPLLEPRLYSRECSSGAGAALASIGIDALPVFARALSSSNRSTRVIAAQDLGWIKGDSNAALALLLSAVRNPDPAVRCAAIFALGRLGVEPEKAIPSLVDRLSDSEAPVRNHAITVLDELITKTPNAKATLQRLLGNSTNSFSPDAADALTRLTNGWTSSPKKF